MSGTVQQMTAQLREARERFGAVALKASMEAEGISLAELTRSKALAAAAGLGLSVKIGGCEALTDARLAREFGLHTIMAPMIESRFALEKFLDMADSVFPAPEAAELKRYINIETADGCGKIDAILAASNIARLDGIVLGRTDLAAALGEKSVDSPVMLEAARKVFEKARAKGIACLVGGGLSEKTVPFLQGLGGLVSGFETRKVVFGAVPQNAETMRGAINAALRFELLWCRFRQEQYGPLCEEDAGRVKKLEAAVG